MDKSETNTKLDVGGTVAYRPGADLRNGARVLRELAQSPKIKGHRYLLTGSLVLTAFCVEAFCQAYGPQILGAEAWHGVTGDKKRRGIERASVLDKLKMIGRRVGVDVHFGKSPWKDIKDAMEARDRLAHAKPELRSVKLVGVDCDADHDAMFREEVARKYEPLLHIDRLSRLAGEIDEAIRQILTHAGWPDYDAELMQFSYWGAELQPKSYAGTK